MRKVSEWLNWLETNEWERWARGTYGDAYESRLQPLRTLLISAAQRFGEQASIFLVRSPGRLNLMGRHIDHRGGFVHPITLPREILLAVQPRDDDIVTVQHAEHKVFPSHSFRIPEVSPVQKLKANEWERWTREQAIKRRSVAGWAIYAEAAIATTVNWCKELGVDNSSSLRGFNVVVYGDIPQEAGLSSSSALFVAFLLASLHRNHDAHPVTPDRLPPEICGYGEWYVGTRGGAGDHAAILLGDLGKVIRIGFFPTTYEHLPFPDGVCLLVMDSGERAHKAGKARAEFNRRVAAYEVGMMIWHEHFPELRDKLKHLRDATPSRLGNEAEIYRLLKSLPRYATFEELERLVPNRKERLLQLADTCQAEHEEPVPLEVRGTCWFGIAECERSELFGEALKNGNIALMGELMAISHDGDRVTRWHNGEASPFHFPTEDFALEAFEQNRVPIWKQAGSYRCSTPAIDFLVDTTLKAGALGAQLSGAGLGGCAMALVRNEEAEQIAEKVATAYRKALGLELSWFIAEPCKGAQVLDSLT